ncbi:MAG: HD domain-containing phosphohydrolase [Methylophilus sp.]|nr:HD domain-containing phosphohydrolase [Methylophilus sp.]
MSSQQILNQLERLNSIGVALSAEQDTSRLLEMILVSAQELTHADGGTLYSVTENDTLKFEIMRNTSLNVALGGSTGKPIGYKPLPIYLDEGKPNLSMVAGYSVIKKTTVNIDDAYLTQQDFDFTGTRTFDELTGYRSKSFLTVPMLNHEHEVIGVLQLINATDPGTQEIIPFSLDNQRLVESLASQAAIALTNHQLISGLKRLFESFIKLIADAIDEKSPYTGGHCQRVPELTMMLTEAAINTEYGPLKDFHMNENELYELKIAAWLHDCGKVTTPESIMDKATKLQTIFDRIHLIDDRFELLKSQREASHLHKIIEAQANGKIINPKHLAHEINIIKKQLDDDKNFIRKANHGTESMSISDQTRVREIANYHYLNEAGQSVKFLTDDEVYNLIIPKGTLTAEERKIINNHIVVTINMLESLPYPKGLRRVPEYAGGHHERMDGTGYPKGLKREQMSIPARIMGIADIFEALTSKDRPYKKAKALSETLNILGKMKLNNHVDPDIFDLFIREKIYLKYAEKFLDPEQIDEIDESKILGYLAD